MNNLNLRDFKEFENTWLRSCDRMNTTKRYQNTKGRQLLKSCWNVWASDLGWHARVEGQGLLVYLDRAAVVSAVLRRGAHYHDHTLVTKSPLLTSDN